MPAITPCLWFDNEAEAAAELYCSVFPDSRITAVSRYPDGMPGGRAGEVMLVAFELDGTKFTALNGGPEFTLSEAVSFEIACETQEDVDHYWDALTADGGVEQPCGWLKDRYGLSWQVVPRRLIELLTHEDREVANRATAAMMEMKKIDIAKVEEAAAAPQHA
jgi:predicted 3-demethylubiquinone-9 3-methyltransferase (glyoxalase superfamily)